MFESATIRLTLFYVGLLLVVGIFFSYNWYSIASAQLDNGYRRQENALTKGPLKLNKSELTEFLTSRAEEVEEAKQAVLGNIVSANILFLTVAGIGSYFLARRTLRPIEQAHEAQRRFTADASHELRTPIASMQTEIEVSLRDKDLTKKDAVKQLESNLEELDKLKDLSSNLLQLARQDEDGKLSLRNHKVARIASDAVARVSKSAKSKKIMINSKVEDAKVVCDKEGITEVLVVLIENAIKYSNEGGEVEVSGKTIGEHYLLSVRDEGRGIKESDLDRIFERFYRADQSRNKTVIPGTGLGLSIAQNIAKQHDTTITVQSTGPDKGSTFSFLIRKSKD